MLLAVRGLKKIIIIVIEKRRCGGCLCVCVCVRESACLHVPPCRREKSICVVLY